MRRDEGRVFFMSVAHPCKVVIQTITCENVNAMWPQIPGVCSAGYPINRPHQIHTAVDDSKQTSY